ncbi:hypothetical protein C3747_71g161 [Trypanosoma cruzi]|uniref:Uncharacterized protein n=2 Tax=Trypanosoma cruzi TaxID=5693 RepID=Q4DVQ5_TRYCC|nr:hypothetical protein, conserved [Trypanosoma cruzi]EAN96596.1 hypothetical protein, conserved [Trypanosoma cruzi]PWV10185.1 hypothetical protein C3747_71g161 [Trypanosoma cruzi]RNC49923.1 hypothetical protein TcCL_NonESM00248 [Trypanosoma cruzi]|eukprot:XP_818447.1 hypothetical protein [Trypanosoma cruzi strain CL Brener]
MFRASTTSLGAASKRSVSNWSSLPFDRRDKSFWLAFNEYLAPSMKSEFPLASDEFRKPMLSGLTVPGESALLNGAIIKAANDLRDYYDNISLWNPLSLAFQLGIEVSVVIEQLLLAKEYGLVSMLFVVSCRSCGCDMLRVDAVREICFRATYHKTNIIRCPMCTDCTEVTDLTHVGVFFQDFSPPEFLRRKYHRLFYSDEAIRRQLEAYFCPPGAAFAFHMRLPEGRYLIVASGMGILVEIQVGTGAEFLGKDCPFHAVTLSLGKLLNENSVDSEGNGRRRRVIRVNHGKLVFRVFNATPYGSYLDFCVAFDERLEFLAPQTPLVATVPMVLHTASRGLRSPLFHFFIPRPPGTRTSGVYVLHSFALPSEEFDEPITAGTESVLAVIREVHRYSLEDHHGLLISVGHGGSVFESSFFSVTAALASSLCLAQRVVTRLGEEVAASFTCTITKGTMYMASFQGQYDDDENLRSSYPDVHVVGPVVYAATHPPVVLTNDRDGKDSVQPVVRCARIELRSVSEEHMGVCLEPAAADAMFPFFLSYLGDQLKALQVLSEPQALVLLVPLSTLNATVTLPSLLNPVMYTKELRGPFG